MNASMNVVFDIGEIKHVKLMIHSLKNEPFVIVDASYSLSKRGVDGIEEQGVCTIDSHIIDMIIHPKEKGEYTLKVTYHIADETLIENVGVYVL